MIRSQRNTGDASRALGGGKLVGVGLVIALSSFGAGCESREARLVSEWQAGCQKGDLVMCADVGQAYAKGIGVSEDAAKAAQIYGGACDRGGARACMLLGLATADGKGVTKDPKAADELLGKACEGGEKDACAYACDELGDAMRCLRTGLLAGKGGTDLQRAVAYYKKACEKGHPLGCREAGFILRDGVGIARDADKAGEMFRRADAIMKTSCVGTNKPDFCE